MLYLIFNEGYAATAGEQLHRVDLTSEAIRLARMLHRLLPDEPEVAGLLALMLLSDARRPARSTEAGDLVTMEHQQRDLWDRALTAEGTALITAAMRQRQVGPYQLQAAIAALHNGAPATPKPIGRRSPPCTRGWSGSHQPRLSGSAGRSL